MRLLLISGFLGSGKTTLVIRLAHTAIQAGERVAVVVNEIGEIGVDDQILRQHDLDVFELLSGCICCTLSVDLITTLQKLDSTYSVDLVIVEASGTADPRGMLSALPYYKGRPLESVRSLVLVDPTRLEVLMEVVTPLITSQIKHAHVILISKEDLASSAELGFARRTAGELNPKAAVVSAAVKQGLEPSLVSELLPWLS